METYENARMEFVDLASQFKGSCQEDCDSDEGCFDYDCGDCSDCDINCKDCNSAYM